MKVLFKPINIKICQDKNGDLSLVAEQDKFNTYYIPHHDIYKISCSPCFGCLRIDGYAKSYNIVDIVSYKFDSISFDTIEFYLPTEKNDFIIKDSSDIEKLKTFFENFMKEIYPEANKILYSGFDWESTIIEIDLYKQISSLLEEKSLEFDQLIRKIRNQEKRMNKTIC